MGRPPLQSMLSVLDWKKLKKDEVFELKPQTTTSQHFVLGNKTLRLVVGWDQAFGGRSQIKEHQKVFTCLNTPASLQQSLDITQKYPNNCRREAGVFKQVKLGYFN